MEVLAPSFGEYWWSLPQDLQGRILGEIDDERRCSIIPCVSRRFYRLHNQFPPLRKFLAVEEPVGPGKLKWFLSIAYSLERLLVLGNGYHPNHTSLLPTMMAKAAAAAPKLKELYFNCSFFIDNIRAPVLKNVTGLTQLTALTFPAHWDLDHSSLLLLNQVSALLLLKKVAVHFCLTEEYINALQMPDTSVWAALARLKSLEHLHLQVQSDLVGGDADLKEFLNPVSLLTQISHLKISCKTYSGHVERIHQANLSALTQLTSLAVTLDNCAFPAFVYQAWSLPSLKKLWLECEGKKHECQGAGIFSHSSNLTALAMVDLDEELAYNSICLPALENLLALYLEKPDLHSFPASFAAALKSCERLTMYSEEYAGLPSVLTQITSLTWLNLSPYCKVHLQESDFAVLAALPNLKRFSPPSVPYPNYAFERRLPHLEIDIDDEMSINVTAMEI